MKFAIDVIAESLGSGEAICIGESTPKIAEILHFPNLLRVFLSFSDANISAELTHFIR